MDETIYPLLVCLLGPLRLLKAGQAIDLRSDSKGAGLLATLALRQGQPISRRALLDTLWPDSEADLASQSLRSLVRDFHKRLRGPLDGATLIAHRDEYYFLNVETGVAVDITIFDVLANAGDQQFRAGCRAEAAVSFDRALRLYHGDLCGGTDVQATVERERLRGRYLSMLARMADLHYSQADYIAGLAYAHRLLAHDPCREDAHRLAMRCYMQLGERAQALRQYRVCADALRTEFDAPPEHATTDLFDQVRMEPSRI